MMGRCLKFLWLVCDSKEGEGEGEGEEVERAEVERAEAQEASELIPKILFDLVSFPGLFKCTWE